jgi:hypothetical protein
MRNTLLLLASGGLLLLSGAALAQTTEGGGGTPDGQPPAFEDPCAGEEGRAFGLCNAYCEAMDCELGHDPADPEGDGVAVANPGACTAVLDNYRKAKGDSEAHPGCVVLEPEPTCPCFSDQDLPIIVEGGPVALLQNYVALPNYSKLTVRADPWESDFKPCELLQIKIDPFTGQGVTEVSQNSDEISVDEAAACGLIVDTFCAGLPPPLGGGGSSGGD